MSLKLSNGLFAAFAAVVAVLVAIQAVDGFRSPAAKAAPPVAMAPAAAGGAGGSVDLPIAGFAFPEGAVNVPVGTKAVWKNTDGTKHTVTADDGSFDSGKLSADQTFEHTFTAAGTFAYACIIHSSMKASITVTP